MKRRILSFLCVFAVLLCAVTVLAFAADAEATLQEQVNGYTGGVIVLEEHAENLNVPKDVCIDLDGHNIAGVTVAKGATLYVMDSQTDDYTVADEVYGKVTGITGTVKAMDGYLQVADAFHRVNLQLNTVVLRPDKTGIYYTSTFAADEVAAAGIESFGVALSVAGTPNESNMETKCEYTSFTNFVGGSAGNKANGTVLKEIMKPALTEEENNFRAAISVYGRAYVKTADGIAFGAAAVYDMKSLTETVDTMWETLTVSQKKSLLNMYGTFASAMDSWNIPNIKAAGKITEAVNKFAGIADNETYTTYTTVTLGELFQSAGDIAVKIESSNVQVTVEPADSTDANNSVGGIYTPNAEDWTKGTLTLTGIGAAKITVTDDYFCIPATQTVTTVMGDVNTIANAMAETVTEELVGENGLISAFCPACMAQKGDSSLKQWYPLPEVKSTASVDQNKSLTIEKGKHHHYYLAADRNNNGFYNVSGGTTQMCLNLSGKNITSSGRVLYTEKDGTYVNIMGTGTVTGNGFQYTDNVNWRGALDLAIDVTLYGGTYKSGNEAPAIAARGSSACDLTIHPGVTVQASRNDRIALQVYGGSKANISGGKLIGGLFMTTGSAAVPTVTLSGAPVIERVTTNRHPLTVGTLTAGASIGMDGTNSTGIFTKSAYASLAAAEEVLPYFHSAVAGYDVAVRYKSLAVVQDIDPMDVCAMADAISFENADPQTGKMTALCPACGYDVEWAPMGNTGNHKVGKHHHYYLTEDKNNSSYYLFTDDAACIHLNGKTVISTQRAFINQHTNSVMNIMGSGVVIGSGTYNASVQNYFGGAVDTTAAVNLYGGTYCGNNGNAAVSVRGSSENNVLNAYGTTITRNYTDTEKGITVAAGPNVYLADFGSFHMYGGTIEGGTASEHAGLGGSYGGNILQRVSIGASKHYSYVSLTDCKVIGGTAATKGGNIAIMGNTNANPKGNLLIAGTTKVEGGSVYVSGKNAELSVADAPEISEIELGEGKLIHVDAMKEGANVTVNAPEGAVVSHPITATDVTFYSKYFATVDPELDLFVVTENGSKVLKAQSANGVCPHCENSYDNITWIELNDETLETVQQVCTNKNYKHLPSGHYKLTGDVSFANQMMIGNYGSTVADNVVMDLNGYTVTLDEGVTTRCMYLTNSGTNLYILDSRPDAVHEDDPATLGGRIIGTANMGGGALYVASGTKAHMYGGTVQAAASAVPSYGGAVYCIGTFNLYDGTINGTTVSNAGGAIYVTGGQLYVYGGKINPGNVAAGMGDCIYTTGSTVPQVYFYGGTVNGEVGHSGNAQVTLSGAPRVRCLYIPVGKQLTVNTLSGDASIGVAAKSGCVFTAAGTAQYLNSFYAYDDKGFAVSVQENALALTEKEELNVGFSRKSVVPDYEVMLGGGSATRMTTECVDDITVSCVAVKQGAQTFLIYTMDFLTAGDGYVDGAKRAISRATGVPETNILMHTTHTHAAPYIGGTNWTNAKQYRSDFNVWVAEAAQAAIADLALADVTYGSTAANNNMVFVRHYKQTGRLTGRVSYFGANFGEQQSDLLYKKEHTSEADRELQMIRFVREGKQDVLMANLPAHATLQQNSTKMSADFPHYFRTYVEANDPDVLCAYFIAAAGDQVPSSHLSGEQFTKDYVEYGNTLGQIAVAALGNMVPASDGDVRFLSKTVTLESHIPDDAEYEKAVAVNEIWKTCGGRATEEGKQAAKDAGFASIYQVSSILNRKKLTATGTMDLRTLAIGEMSFVFSPYEMFGQDGMSIKNGNAANHSMTFIVTCGEGDEGYIPTDFGWQIGTYESHVTMFKRLQNEGTAEQINTNLLLNNEFLAMLEALKEN